MAYAASTGIATWEYDEQETREITAALKTFAGLSVREEESVRMMREHCGVEVHSILDPTLLADSQIYDPLRKKAKLSGSGKLVTYILDWTTDKQRIIERACAVTGLEVQHVLPKEKKRRGILSRIVNQDSCVYDWVNQIATADFVVTDSFHGTAFSLIFNKQFVVIGNTERGMARFTSLLKQFGLTNRLSVDMLPDVTRTIDYQSINKILNDRRIEGINFLRNSL